LASRSDFRTFATEMRQLTLIDSKLLHLIITRLACQLIENHDDFSNTVIVGMQPRGVLLAEMIFDAGN